MNTSEDRATYERAICLRFSSRIRAYGLRHLRDDAGAKDLVQTVLMSVLLALRENRVAEPDRLDAYVLGTCRNAVMDLRRGVTRREKLATQAAAVFPSEYEPAWEALDTRRLEHCLGELEQRERSVVLATFVDDRDAGEIGDSIGVSTGNVRVIRHRAITRLQTCVEGQGQGAGAC